MEKKKKVLVIVAHPDDETIFMGGTLFRNKNNWDTTIISLCRREDKDRAPKFHRACTILKAHGFMSDLEDEQLDPVNVDEIIKRILDYTDKSYDEVYTHGENGEYGHKRHIDVHNAVNKIIDDKIIKFKKIYFFSYKLKSAPNTDIGFDVYADNNANKFINLDNLEFLTKKYLIKNIYGFQKGGFEERNCRDKEAFTKAL